jgi:hypothetical protein
MKLIAFALVLFVLVYVKLTPHGSVAPAFVAEEVYSGLFQVAPTFLPKATPVRRPAVPDPTEPMSSIR